MSIQRWHCEHCRARGSVTYEDEEGLYAVALRISEAHRHAWPQCKAGTRRLRVVNETAAQADTDRPLRDKVDIDCP